MYDGIWAHASCLYPSPTLDGYSIGECGYQGYSTFGERQGNHDATIGVIAHELGHSLGMVHDFLYPFTYCPKPKRCFRYRKYENDPKDCRGLMDYIKDGVNWSKCSAADFSRYITRNGTKDPCIGLPSKYFTNRFKNTSRFKISRKLPTINVY